MKINMYMSMPVIKPIPMLPSVLELMFSPSRVIIFVWIFISVTEDSNTFKSIPANFNLFLSIIFSILSAIDLLTDNEIC